MSDIFSAFSSSLGQLLEDVRHDKFDKMGLEGFTSRSHVLSNHNEDSASAIWHYGLLVHHEMLRINYARNIRNKMAMNARIINTLVLREVIIQEKGEYHKVKALVPV